MKIQKSIAVFCAAVLAVSAASASGLKYVTNGALTNDADNYIDVNNWQQVTFKNMFAETSLDNSNLSFGVAKNFGKAYGAFNYYGNTWSDTPSNNVSLLYGAGALGVLGGFHWASSTQAISGVSADVNLYAPFVTVGYNIKSGAMEIDLLGTFEYARTSEYGSSTVLNTTVEGSSDDVFFTLGALLKLPAKGILSQSVGAYFNGAYLTVNETKVTTTVAGVSNTVTSPSSKTDSNVLVALYRLGAKFSDRAEYAGVVSFVSDFTDSLYDLSVNNGIQAYIVPKVIALNGGLLTTFPTMSL